MPAVLALTAIVVMPAAAQDLPTRKPGLWEMKMVFEGRNMPAQSIRQCTDPSTDKLMHANFGGMAQDVCPERNIQRSGNTITVDATCKFGGGAMTTKSHSVITGNFDSAYTVKVTSTRTGGAAAAAPNDKDAMERARQYAAEHARQNGDKQSTTLIARPAAPPAETHMTIEAKYLGPCEAGQKPGDIIMSNGMKMNVQNMPKVPGMGASDSMIHGGGTPPAR
jgi:hypothetical protein